MSKQIDAQTYRMSANSLFDQEKYTDACEAYRKAAEIDPTYTAAYDGWGASLTMLNKLDEAIEKFKMAIGIDPNHAKAYYGWGFALFNKKEYKQAIEKYRKAIEIDKDHAKAYNGWGICLYHLGEIEKAIEKYRKATELEPNYAMPYSNWGLALTNLKEYDQAVEKYKKAVECNPRFALARFNWGVYLSNQKKYPEAIQQYQKAVEADPNYVNAYFNLGVIHGRLKNYDEAIEQYRKVVEVKPGYVEAYNNWGTVLLKKKKYKEATEKHQKAIEIDRDHPYAYHNIADTLWKQGKYKTGLEQWEKTCEVYERTKSIAKSSHNVDSFQYYGNVLHEIFGCLNKASDVYKEGHALEPNHIGILLGLINLHLEIKDEHADQKTTAYWKARELYRKAEGLLLEELKSVEDAPTLLKLGQLHLTMEEYAEAQKYLLKALEKDNESAEVYDALGVLCTRRKNFEKGVQHFKKALQRDPDNLSIQSNLAEAYLKAKSVEDALDEYKKILAITTDHVESQIGLGEVYTAMADAGDKELYGQAINHFNEGIKLAEWKKGSKRLKRKELAAVYYSRGYAMVNFYEASKTIRDESLLQKASEDFKKCSRNDPDNYKAIRALEKIEKRLKYSPLERLAEQIGPVVITLLSLIVFILTQSSFFFGRPVVSIDAGYHSLLTFGSLMFMVAGLYLPQLLKLKVAGIELEKSVVDQITTSGTLGISK